MKTVIYVHGYGSSMKADKVGFLKNTLPDDYVVVGQDYNYDTQSPNSIIKGITQFALQQLKKPTDQVFLIGSSLGGFITLNVLNRINTKAVLVNPSVSPHINLSKRDNKFADEYRRMAERLPSGNYKNVLCMVSDDDDVIDVAGLDNFNFKKVNVSGGGHRMLNFDAQMKTIISYFEKTSLLQEHGLFLD